MAKLPINELIQTLASSNARWTAGDNPVSVMDEVKRNRMLGVVVPAGYARPLSMTGDAAPNFDPLVDWRNRNGNHISPVKNQGGCGSCVSFSTVGVAEAMASIEKSSSKYYSEADLHFCSSHGPTCAGWWHDYAYDQLIQRGLLEEKLFPYSSAFTSGDIWNGAPSCRVVSQRALNATRISTVNKLFYPNEIKNYLTQFGPLSAIMEVYTDFFSYKEGVYHKVSGNFEGMHCFMVVGFSETDQCWIGKNSWDVSWGDSGFFKIGYGECGVDDYEKIGMSGLILPPPQNWFTSLFHKLYGKN